ncbi:MAG: ABC transporter substrate-binding protein [Cytophagales bacterium]|nr:ABC transporter substrate-binding protein [Cytophagales bacterium]
MIKNYSVLFACLLLGCSQPAKDIERQLSLSHAVGFHFEEKSDGRYLVIDEPWPNAKTTKEYKLEKPFKKIVCTSTSHLPFFEMLGKEETVIGFPNVNYISSEVFRERAAEGLIADLGSDASINLELLLSLQPDAVIAFDSGGGSGNLDKITEAGIPVIYNSDFLETSPLGRAEWIKFFGALLDEEKRADSIFSVIEKEYTRLAELGKGTNNKPTVLNGVVYGDTWFMPGGRNWASVFYENAGGKYLWADDTTTSWLELSFESVFDKGRQAEFWIGTSSFNSKGEMLAAEGRYEDFEPFTENRVYNYSKKRTSAGAYDFFESAYARPDLVLADLIKILHPELLPEYETVYFEKLK